MFSILPVTVQQASCSEILKSWKYLQDLDFQDEFQYLVYLH